MVGAQGFARPPVTSAVLGGFAQVAIHPLLLGVQAGNTFADGARSHAAYGLATIGYAQSRAYGWQVYPFLAAGAASFRTAPGDADLLPAFGAGFGADALFAPHRVGPMLGVRVGYITRSLGDDGSVAYATMSLGLGGRRAQRDDARPVAASRWR